MPVATKEYGKESLLQKQRISSHEESLMFSLLIKVVSGIFPFSKEHLWVIANNRSFWQKCEIPTHFQVT